MSRHGVFIVQAYERRGAQVVEGPGTRLTSASEAEEVAESLLEKYSSVLLFSATISTFDESLQDLEVFARFGETIEVLSL